MIAHILCRPTVAAITAERDWWRGLDLPGAFAGPAAYTMPGGTPPHAVISMGASLMDETFAALARFPVARLYAHCWDVYEWVWEPGWGGKAQAKHPSRPDELDYVRYGDLLRAAHEVWVPTACTGRRVRQWYGVPPEKVHVVHPKVTLWDPPVPVKDGGYALMCLREIPDRYWGRFEAACERLGILHVNERHERPRAEFQRLVAGCRFLCAPLYELSTGGLSLLEGYALGKPVLISDSEWNGAVELFGGRAHLFRHDDEADFERALRFMASGHAPVPQNPRAWVEETYGPAAFFRRVRERLGVV